MITRKSTVIDFNSVDGQQDPPIQRDPREVFIEAVGSITGGAPSPDTLIPGRMVRFATSDRRGDLSGWAKLFSDGEGGTFGCWRQGISETWQAREPRSPEERHAFLEHVRQAREESARLKEQLHAECRGRSAKEWNGASPATDSHPYLLAKDVRSHGLRLAQDGRLLVPVQDTAGTLHGMQYITPDGTKLFKTGTAVAGCYHAIGKPNGRICIAEGYATGASIHEATGAAVAVAFNAGNLKPVAEALRSKYPELKIVVCADDDHATEGNPGLTKAREAAKAVNGKLAIPTFPDTRGPKDTDFNDLARLVGPDAVKACIEAAMVVPTSAEESPVESKQGGIKANASTLALPLTRYIPQADPYPLDAFPSAMRNAAERMVQIIQSPAALTGQSLLAAATLAAQAHINVLIDGRVSPVSNNFLTVGESGERKSANDKEANRETRERQKQDHHRSVTGRVELEADQLAWDATRRRITSDKKMSHDEIKAELEALGERPTSPLAMRYTEEPTYEGLVRGFSEGNLSIGLYTDEGGRFLGGFAMNQENATKTITGLSKLWDGDHITRSRGGDGNILVYGVRLSVHLMIQPVLADKVFSDPLLSGQGFMSRCLCSFPESTIGNRPYKEADLSDDPMMSPYHERMREIINLPYPMGPVGMGLNPRNLVLCPDAKRVWIAFHNHVEGLMKDGAPLRTVKGFASKAAEHAARLAAVLGFFDDIEIQEIGVKHIEAGIALSEYYIGEALRLFNSATTNPDLLLAEKVLTWARHPDRNGIISLVDLYQKGPSQVRTKAAANRVIAILEDHNQVDQVEGGCKVNGTFKRDVWRVRV